jgi:hypothetical protein
MNSKPRRCVLLQQREVAKLPTVICHRAWRLVANSESCWNVGRCPRRLPRCSASGDSTCHCRGVRARSACQAPRASFPLAITGPVRERTTVTSCIAPRLSVTVQRHSPPGVCSAQVTPCSLVPRERSTVRVRLAGVIGALVPHPGNMKPASMKAGSDLTTRQVRLGYATPI